MALTSSRPPCRKTLRRPWCRSSSIRTTRDGRERVKVRLSSCLHLSERIPILHQLHNTGRHLLSGPQASGYDAGRQSHRVVRACPIVTSSTRRLPCLTDAAPYEEIKDHDG